MPRLSDIPGLAGVLEARQQNEASTMRELQQAQGVMTLSGLLQQQQQKQQAAQREAQYRAELQGLGPNPTQEALAAVGAKYSGPEKLMDIQQKSLDRQAASTDRREMAAEARAQQAVQFAQGLDQRQQALDLRAETERQRITDAAARQQFEQWYKTESLNNQRARDQLNGQLRTMGFEIQRTGQQLQLQRLENRPMTEFQGKAALYGTRAAQSDKILTDLEERISLEGLATKQSLAKTPVIGGVLGYAGNLALSPEQQRVEQAQRDFVNAVLRQESGAVISDPEFANAQKQYFPAPGDSKQVIEQKRQNRKLAIQGFSRMSGPMGARDIEAISNTPLMPGRAAPGRSASGSVPPPPPGFTVNP